MANELNTTVSQGPPDSLATRLERWISIARHRGYGTMTEGDWEGLESVLVRARARVSSNTTVTSNMLEDGYEALREHLPIDMRPLHGPITPDDLMCMAEACYRAMEAARAK